jgi:hypothetical protein
VITFHICSYRLPLAVLYTSVFISSGTFILLISSGHHFHLHFSKNYWSCRLWPLMLLQSFADSPHSCSFDFASRDSTQYLRISSSYASCSSALRSFRMIQILIPFRTGAHSLISSCSHRR